MAPAPLTKQGSGTIPNRVLHAAGAVLISGMFEIMAVLVIWMQIEAFAPDRLPPSRTALAIGSLAGLLVASAFGARAWRTSADFAWFALDQGRLIVGRARGPAIPIDAASAPEILVESREFVGKARHARFTIELRTRDEDFILLAEGSRSEASAVFDQLRQACPGITVHASGLAIERGPSE